MNKVVLIGRLTGDPVTRQTQSGINTARFTLAVDGMKNKDGNAKTDFISCVAWDKKADFAEKYLSKGMKIAIEGRISTGSYTDKDGKKVYTTDVVIDQQEFCEKKVTQTEESQELPQAVPEADADGFMNIPDGFEEELPWN